MLNERNFLGLPAQETLYEKSYFTVVPVPYEKTTSYKKGTRYGPQAIINASAQVEFLDEECLVAPCRVLGVNTQDSVLVDTPEELVTKLSELASKAAYDSKFPLFLGGEHTITEGIVYGLLKKYPALSVLQFDAHCDLRPQYGGTKYSHACAMYRIKDRCKLAQIGIRNLSEEELPFINKGNVKTYFMHQNRDVAELIKSLLSFLGNDVFITIDLDGLDPNVVPSVGTPVPDGFTFEQATRILREIISKKNVVGADINELCPSDDDNVSSFTTAKLIHKIMAYQTFKLKGGGVQIR